MTPDSYVAVPPKPVRRHRRFPLRYPVLVKFSRGDTSQAIEAWSRNVSIGGMLLETAAAIPDACPITFVLKVEEQQTVRPIQLSGEGKVVRVEMPEKNGNYTIAIECSRPIAEMDYLAAS